MNDCELAAGLLPELWQHQLEAPERAADRIWLRRHLENCADCASLAAFWQKLGELPAAEPDQRQRQRFDQMLAAYQQGMDAAVSIPTVLLPRSINPSRSFGRGFAALAFRPLPALAAALLLVAGLAAGWFVRGARLAPATPSDAQQIAELRDQVQNTRQLAVLSLLQQQSASDRLQGVSYSNRLQGTDPQVLEALLNSLKYDSSPDVRLAVVDALARHSAEPGIQKGLVDAFHYQNSPLVQIALVDSFVETHDQQARDLLQQVSRDTAYNPEVRQRAAWGLAQPTWN
ncbi:MAG TPA: HEAT repeat domain-containing protein [Terriglobales bacterium]|nr:HEAT repeat domain-containing protein [Terriglobales bacterium]